MSSLYNYNKAKEEVDNLKIEQLNNIVLILFSACLLLISIVIIIFLYLKHRSYKQRQRERLISIRNKVKKQKYIINESKQQIQDLEQSILDLKKAYIEDRKNNNVSSNTLQIPTELYNSAIYQKVWKQIFLDGVASKRETVDNLIEYINEHFRDIIAKFYTINKLSKQELRLCVLQRLGFSSLQISEILNVTGSAISHTRARLSKKIFGESATSKDLDKFISS